MAEPILGLVGVVLRDAILLREVVRDAPAALGVADLLDGLELRGLGLDRDQGETEPPAELGEHIGKDWIVTGALRLMNGLLCEMCSSTDGLVLSVGQVQDAQGLGAADELVDCAAMLGNGLSWH